jgi:hypothetical protein
MRNVAICQVPLILVQSIQNEFKEESPYKPDLWRGLLFEST